MIKIEFRPSAFKVRHLKPQYIVLHHSSEFYDNPAASVDSNKLQIPYIINGVLEQKTFDVNYHYIIEKIKGDYFVLVGRPLVFQCDFNDIASYTNKVSIHIALLGNYDIVVPTKRVYEVLAYKLINPLLKTFNLSYNRVKFHNEISSNENISCPGEFFSKEVLLSMIRRYVIK